MVSVAISPVLDNDGQETVQLAMSVSANPTARDHVARALAEGARPSYARAEAEWFPDEEVTKPFTAEVIITMDGPTGTAYADAAFRIQLSFRDTYPETPPAMRFASIIYHPQVEEGGLLEDDVYDALEWHRKANRSVTNCLSVLHQMLVEPLPSAMPVPRPVRRRIELMQQRRTRTIRAYKPLHPELFDICAGPLPDAWINGALLAAVRSRDEAALDPLLTEEAPGVYSLDFCTPLFRKLLLEETDHFLASGLPSGRPNSMNKYGLIVNEMGLERLMDLVLQQVVCPIAESVYSSVPGARSLDHHHSFTVQYSPDTDRHLDMHHDDSEVTLNACLGRDFEGAGLTFCGVFGSKEYRKFSHKHAHVPGRAVLHLGRHRHGADDITAGSRCNLILWAKSSSLRSLPLSQQQGRPQHAKVPPSELCLSYTHDVDFEDYRPLPEGVVGKRERPRLARERGAGG